ncbi:MAG: mechanosensitive ion channel [Candidatus Omnitrophica bacterium]|nr:mechanosensitive ion channel [Candidatus Omnitrophota bacterium]
MLDSQSLYYAGHIVLLLAASVLVGRIAGPVFTRLLEALSGRTASTLDDRVIKATKGPIESFFFLGVFYFLIHAFPELSSAAQFLEHYIYAIIVVISTYLLSEASGAAIRWYYEEGHKTGRLGMDLSLLPLVRKVTKLAIYAIGFTVALSATGFDVTGLLAVTSVAGIILGLASQETLGNLFAGIALQMDRPYRYGDYLSLPGGEIAIVRKIGMRSTRLEDTSYNTIIISNSEFAKMRITNLSLPNDVSVVGVTGELPLGADLAKLESRLSSALSRAKPAGLLQEKGYSLVIDSAKPSSVAFTFSFWVKGYQHAVTIRKIINREILAFAKGKK